MILSRFHDNTLVAVCLWLVLASPTIAGADESGAKPKSALRLEVEVERGKDDLDRLTIYICNDTKDEFSFTTGAAGGPGSLDDRVKSVGGTPPTVVPELSFSHDNTEVVVRAPSFGGPPRRSMRPAQFTVQPSQRLMYASFAVPHAHIRGTFVMAKLTFPGHKEISRLFPATPHNRLVGADGIESFTLLGFADGFTEKASPAK